MPGSYVKVDYHKIKLGSITLPIYHTYIEIKDDEKVRRFGFTTKNKFYWPISMLFPIYGYISKETYHVELSKLLTRNKRKVKKLLKAIQESTWHHYQLFFHNCFEWRNSVLRKAGISPPKDHYWAKKR